MGEKRPFLRSSSTRFKPLSKPPSTLRMDPSASAQMKKSRRYSTYLQVPVKRGHYPKGTFKVRWGKLVFYVLVVAFILALIIIGIRLLYF